MKLKYTIMLEFRDGTVIEGESYSSSGECWGKINYVLELMPELKDSITFTVVESRME